MASLMEKSMDTVIDVFHRYSTRQGHQDRLNQSEFKQLVQQELPNFIKKEGRDEKAINEIMEDLDTNVDKDLSFEEFSMLVARMTHAAHEEMHKDGHSKGHNHSHGSGFGAGDAVKK